MSNIFDRLQEQAFDITTQTMGYTATWQPMGSVEPLSGKVLFNNPEEDARYLGKSIEQTNPMMEYRKGVFPGLYEYMQVKTNDNPTVIINGESFFVIDITAKIDGKTFEASLQKA